MANNLQDMEKLLCRSIEERRILIINYKDEPERLIEPYIYGKDVNGLKLSAYQISGYSGSGTVPEWKLFKVELINHVKQLDWKFTVRKTYNPDFEIVTKVFCKV